MSKTLRTAGRQGAGKALLLAVLLLAVLDAYAERPVRSLLEYRTENLILQQWDNSCAAAALASVLTYHLQFPVTEKQVATGLLGQTDEVRVRARGGFSLLDMKRYLHGLGFDGQGYKNLSLDDLAAMSPMIVPIRSRAGYDHFVIVRRVTGTHVDVGDPAFGNYAMKRAAFTSLWTATGFGIQPKSSGVPR